MVVAPEAVGICATDLEILDGTLIYLRTGASRYPVVPGHEWTGRVLAVGQEVAEVRPGDRVVGECSIGCAVCGICRAGAYHQCPSRRETGILGLDGALSTELRLPARATHVIAPHVDPLDAALIEPLAVAYRAVRRAGIPPGESVLVVGAGTIGALAIAVLTRSLNCDVSVADRRADRVERATALGARPHDPGRTYVWVVEATGSAGGLELAHASLSPGGTLVVVGLTGHETVAMDVDALVVNDHRLLGSLGSPGVWPDVISLVESGRVRPGSLVTDVFTLDEWEAAFERVRGGSAGGKVVIRLDSAQGA
ncbi:zinc-dependent alcohol dehydrogenase [Jiangella endophytica]|uniref:zinc-dependent alcohol dehydrogenase n=1 Tax=Jiangella endophytica TaxID=1623398 RepID=UPI0018E5A4BE|nr:alcohol dehydrogenase catalytic domain-containing protein [Jiangella endophytica]